MIIGYSIDNTASVRHSLLVWYFGLLLLTELTFGALVYASMDRDTGVGEQAILQSKVYSHGLGEVYVGFLDQLQPNAELNHRNVKPGIDDNSVNTVTVDVSSNNCS